MSAVLTRSATDEEATAMVASDISHHGSAGPPSDCRVTDRM